MWSGGPVRCGPPPSVSRRGEWDAGHVVQAELPPSPSCLHQQAASISRPPPSAGCLSADWSGFGGCDEYMQPGFRRIHQMCFNVCVYKMMCWAAGGSAAGEPEHTETEHLLRFCPSVLWCSWHSKCLYLNKYEMNLFTLRCKRLIFLLSIFPSRRFHLYWDQEGLNQSLFI